MLVGVYQSLISDIFSRKAVKGKWLAWAKSAQHSVHPPPAKYAGIMMVGVGARFAVKQFARLGVGSGKAALSCPAHQYPKGA